MRNRILLARGTPQIQTATEAPWRSWLLVEITLALPISLFVASQLPAVSTLRYGVALTGVLAIQHACLLLLRQRMGPEPNSVANLLTLCRATLGSILAALVLAGFSERLSPVGWLGAALAIGAATLLDWIDGPLARRSGPTRFGAVLDIESDSWLTLTCGAAAVTWGALPWWCLLAPLLRYIQPALTLRRGGLPAGGGPWWSRVTGVGQMVLLLGALLPIAHPQRLLLLSIAAVPISAAQVVTVLVLLVSSLRATAQPSATEAQS